MSEHEEEMKKDEKKKDEEEKQIKGMSLLFGDDDF